MIIVTGAAGFIGSCLSHFLLNKFKSEHFILVDDFSREDKLNNLPQERCRLIDRNKLFEDLKDEFKVTAIYHLGARTDTTEMDKTIFNDLNVAYSKKLWTYACEKNIPFLYASSAATYGGGEHGFDDDESQIEKLKPLNPYGQSKQDFDIWALAQKAKPPSWYGLKFFNVFGPNEYHKGRMASVIFHTFNKIQSTGKMQLFRSHREDYEDGMQSRDFIYIQDVVEICHWLIDNKVTSGIYNVGTGKARTFLDLATSVFNALELEPNIEFIDTPEDIRDKYQYYTQANMNKLISAGYPNNFHSLEDGIERYVKDYLVQGSFYCSTSSKS